MKPLSPSWRRRISAAGVVALVALAVTVFAWAARTDTAPRTDGPGIEPLPVAWLPVAWEDRYAVNRDFVGRVEARQETDLGFEVPGMIARVEVEEGQRVESGTVIARLDTQRLDARLNELSAALTQAKAQHELAEIRLRRITDLRERDAATADELDEAQTTFEATRADALRAEAAVNAVEVDLAKSQLYAPFDAVVAVRYADAGRVVDAGVPVLRLLERQAPEVRFGIGGDAVSDLRVGQRFEVRVGQRMVQGELNAILPTRDRLSRGVDVMVVLDAEVDGIRSGDLARLRLERTVESRGFWLPTQALTEGVRGLWSVYTFEPTENDPEHAIVRRTDVEVIHQETDRAYVRGALDGQTRIAVGGLHRVAPGMLVRFDPEHDASDALAQELE